ncbi:MAG: replicative DNA helicase [Gemmatimonadetes bacterium GWC2_71_9]|nr:MAG: replicative DNA helicase [Gemmatimonadetes bacterium GWC2_71_9]OGT95112.1 MAG: replicative DNA helicase [Gemmatimonadetes bacterium RIFCSPLOWO2_02_FULL_71_11]
MTSVSPAASSTAKPSDPFGGRQPPYSPEAEQAVLGAMLLDADAALRAAETLEDWMFYREGHRRLFRVMIGMTRHGGVVDPITLKEELERKGELDAAGGVEYLSYLLDAVPTAANFDYHAKIVRDKALLRRLVEVGTQIVQEAFEGKRLAAEVLDAAERKIFEVAEHRTADGFERLKKLLWPTMERIESLHGAGQTITGVASGFKDLDERTAGFQPSDLVIVAARPAMGKTAFCLNVAQHAAIEHSTGVAIFSLEMSREGIVQRLLTSEARVDAHRLRSGTLRDADYKLLAGAAGILSSAPIWIDDSASLTPLELRSKARRIKAEQDIGLIMVDYLQLMREPEYSENRVQEISAISRSLKALAKELHVPVIALSQLSRAPEQRGGEGRRPQLSDLRESGAIEQDADVVLFIYRAEMYAKPEERDEVAGQAEVIIGKQRNGPTGMVKLFFHNQYTRFDNYSAREPVESGDGA